MRTCWEFGGILASITKESEYIESMTVCDNITDSNGCWFGLNKISGIWRHLDGSEIRNSLGFDVNGNPNNGLYPWNANEPNNMGSNEECAELTTGEQFKWNDFKCGSHILSVCMKNPPKACGININDLKVWYKGGLNDISNNGNDAINVTGNIYNDINDCSVYGDTNSSFIIPYNINTTSYTIVYMAKYNGNNKQRILTSRNDTNYVTGFYNGNEGVCYQGSWITQQNTGSNNDWIIMTSYPNGCRANGINMNNDNLQAWTSEPNPGTINIGINIFNNNENSDWKMYELMIFDTILSEYQMKCIEEYLSQEHNIPINNFTPDLSVNPTKTCPQTLINPQTPSKVPTSNPTNYPSKIPTNNPSIVPTLLSESPSNIPTHNPTLMVSVSNNVSSNIPTTTPTHDPSTRPTNTPSIRPTLIYISTSYNYTNSPSLPPSNTAQLSNNVLDKNMLTLQLVIFGSILIGCCACIVIWCIVGIIMFNRRSNILKTFIANNSFSSDNEVPSPSVKQRQHSDNYSKEGIVTVGDTSSNNGNV